MGFPNTHIPSRISPPFPPSEIWLNASPTQLCLRKSQDPSSRDLKWNQIALSVKTKHLPPTNLLLLPPRRRTQISPSPPLLNLTWCLSAPPCPFIKNTGRITLSLRGIEPRSVISKWPVEWICSEQSRGSFRLLQFQKTNRPTTYSRRIQQRSVWSPTTRKSLPLRSKRCTSYHYFWNSFLCFFYIDFPPE